jgi:hypothetical protein
MRVANSVIVGMGPTTDVEEVVAPDPVSADGVELPQPDIAISATIIGSQHTRRDLMGNTVVALASRCQGHSAAGRTG